jgi:ribose 5-phosphate isomerase A
MSDLQNQLKLKAAEAAVDEIQTGMAVGIGEGTTVLCAIEVLANRVKSGLLKDIVCITASERMSSKAKELGLNLTHFGNHPTLDLTIDGADEVDPNLNLIKGGGGALLREKILAQASNHVLIIVDESKLSPKLGTNWALPIEVTTYGWQTQIPFLESLNAKVTLRHNADNTPFHTDQGNVILDVNLGPISDAESLALQLDTRAGIVEHGLFMNMADKVIIANKDGIRWLVV